MVDKSEKFRWLVRLGFAARGLVYLLVGFLALTASRGENGPEGAFDLLQDAPLGAPILYLAAAGLLGYALYRLCSLLFDVENYGTSSKGIAHRIGHGASGLAHFVLAWTAFQFAQGDKQTASSGDAQGAAGTLLSFPFWSLVQSAWLSSSAQVKSLGEAVGSLADNGTLYTLVAAGLVVFGLFSLLLARYRIVPDLDRADLRPRLH